MHWFWHNLVKVFLETVLKGEMVCPHIVVLSSETGFCSVHPHTAQTCSKNGALSSFTCTALAVEAIHLFKCRNCSDRTFLLSDKAVQWTKSRFLGSIQWQCINVPLIFHVPLTFQSYKSERTVRAWCLNL